QRTNVYGAGKLLATYDPIGLHFHLTDPLGTRRVQTSSVGQPETDIQSLPFGNQLNSFPDQYAPGTADDSTPLHFTGKERDTESGNDYFGARYYSSAMGRFMSPDWSAKIMPVPYATMGDPQSLNLYAYVRNNPLTGVDADGHCDKNGMLCQAWTWLTSNHSASASASATASQGSASNGFLSGTGKVGTAQASASASYGTNTSVSAKGSATLASTTINEGTHSTTQVDSHTVTADAHAGVSLGGDKGVSASAGAGAGAYVLSASQTETITLGPITITGSASGNVGVGANASASIGTSGVSASAGVTPGWGGSLSLSVGWNGMSVSGGGSAKGTMTTTTTSVDKPKVE
ncbi:MAG: RHS repeat-associated core domain-containing protein, partial [Formivibrio sp.]|nr:RHS repeat-associated core domain-containing protein [Formivibrio sp.]